MNPDTLTIDAFGTIEFRGGRKAELDLWELRKLCGTLSARAEVVDANGARAESTEKLMAELRAYVKEQGGIDISEGEAIGLWNANFRAWEKKKASWAGVDAAAPNSPASTAFPVSLEDD